MRGDYLLKRSAIPRLANRKRASRPEHAMEKYRLPHGKLYGRKTVARRNTPGKTQRGRRSDRKLFDPAHCGRRGVNMKRVPPLQHKYFKTRNEPPRKLKFPHRDVFRIDMWNDEKAWFSVGRG
jgi:hypothetical protein